MQQEIHKVTHPKTEPFLDSRLFLECKDGSEKKIANKTDYISCSICRVHRNYTFQQKIRPVMNSRCRNTDNDKAEELCRKEGFKKG